MPDPDAVDRYVVEHLVAGEPAAVPGLPPHEVSPPQGKLLYLIALAARARTILEVGTLGGYSAGWLARAVPEDGRLVTLEADPERAALARAALGGHPQVEVVTGPALETLPGLVGPFDLVFLDADKAESAAYLEHALRLTRPGSVIVADNVVRGGALADPDDPDPRVRGVRAFVEAAGADPRLEATVIQTVGAKGHDGFALAVVVSPSG